MALWEYCLLRDQEIGKQERKTDCTRSPEKESRNIMLSSVSTWIKARETRPDRDFPAQEAHHGITIQQINQIGTDQHQQNTEQTCFLACGSKPRLFQCTLRGFAHILINNLLWWRPLIRLCAKGNDFVLDRKENVIHSRPKIESIPPQSFGPPQISPRGWPFLDVRQHIAGMSSYPNRLELNC